MLYQIALAVTEENTDTSVGIEVGWFNMETSYILNVCSELHRYVTLNWQEIQYNDDDDDYNIGHH
jgi:hypothetical protein